MNSFKHTEFMRNQRMLDEVNFADSASLKQLYLYVLNSELTWLLEADEAAAEYHDGKFDPSMLKYADPKKLKKKEQVKKKVPLWEKCADGVVTVCLLFALLHDKSPNIFE